MNQEGASSNSTDFNIDLGDLLNDAGIDLSDFDLSGLNSTAFDSSDLSDFDLSGLNSTTLDSSDLDSTDES